MVIVHAGVRVVFGGLEAMDRADREDGERQGAICAQCQEEYKSLPVGKL